MDLITILAAVLILVGGLATLLCRSSFDKLVMLGILTAGAILFIVDGGYLDVAIAISLLMPIGSLFILFLLGRKKTAEEIEAEKTKPEVKND